MGDKEERDGEDARSISSPTSHPADIDDVAPWSGDIDDAEVRCRQDFRTMIEDVEEKIEKNAIESAKDIEELRHANNDSPPRDVDRRFHFCAEFRPHNGSRALMG